MSAKPLHLLVSGPYGGLNLGDDAIASVICSQLIRRNALVTLAAINAEQARRLNPHVFVTERLNLRSGRLASLHAVRDCDAVLIGGGEQFSEPRIPNPIWGHLAINTQLSCLASFFGKEYAVLGVGIDSQISKMGRLMMRSALRKAAFIGVRDSNSQQYLADLPSFNKEVFLGADPVFLMDPFCRETARNDFENRFGIPHSSRIVLMILSIDKFNSLDYLKTINKVVQKLVADGLWILYAVTDVQPSFDLELFRKRMLYQDKKVFWLLPGEDGITGVRRAIAAADCVISSRMHPIIFAAVQKTPFVCLARSAKMHALMKMLDVSDYLTLNNFIEEELLSAVRHRLKLGSECSFEPLAAPLAILKARAAKQFDELMLRLETGKLS